MLTVLGRATSSNVQALLWGLEELGLKYERLDYGEAFGGLDTPAFRALNPHGKIPVLKVGDHALFETPAILRYLATEHGAETFWPRDPLARARVDMWAEWAKHDIAEAFTGPVFWEAVRKRPEKRNVDLIQRNLNAFEDQLALAEPRLARNAVSVWPGFDAGRHPVWTCSVSVFQHSNRAPQPASCPWLLRTALRTRCLSPRGGGVV